MKNIFFSYCICILFSLIAYTSAAQKLPDKQRNGVFILANLKVDGKATEWDNKFQAYNKTVEVFYTIANDSDKLYLIIQATEPDVMNKIMRSGVDFSVNSLTKGKDKTAVKITYPVSLKPGAYSPVRVNELKQQPNTPNNKNQRDSLMKIINRKLTAQAKTIAVTGIKAIPSDTVSIYNEYGIEAAALFDNELNYTCEFVIPIKYLGLLADNSFVYTIQINGIKNPSLMGADVQEGIQSLEGVGNSFIATGPTASRFMFLASSTNFSGQYTLVKNR